MFLSYHAYVDTPLMENIAIKAIILNSYVVMTPMEAVMTIPALLLQKPHARSRSTEHASHLQERLEL